MEENYKSMQSIHSVQSGQSRDVSPQVKLYNRQFYLRKAQHADLQQQYNTQIKQLANTPKITPNSYIILSEKVQKEIQKVVEQECKQNPNLQFPQLQNILKKLLNTEQQFNSRQYQLFTCQIWLLLNNYQLSQSINNNLLITFLRILFDPYNLSIKQMHKLISSIPNFQSQNLQQNRKNFINTYPDLSDQTLTIQQLLVLWNKIKINNLKFNKNKKKIIIKQRQHIKFKPQINSTSKNLAQQSLKKYVQNNRSKLLNGNNQLQKYISIQNNNNNLQNISYHQILYQRKLQKDNILQKKIHQQLPINYNFPKATPQQISNIVKNLYYKKIKNDDIDYQKKQQQQQLKHCSFKPKINHITSSRSISPLIKNYSKDILRVNKARQQQIKKKLLYQNLGRVRKSSKNIQAPSFIQRDTPKLILEVKIDQDRIQKINLKGDQDPKIVAKKFVKKHNLSECMQSVLEQLVSQQLNCL